MKEVIEDILLFINDNIDNNIALEDLENRFHYNRAYIVRAFKEYTGLTIKEYINKMKIYNTLNQLTNTDDTILKIALTNGFNSQEYYSEKFKDVIGISPLKFRKICLALEIEKGIELIKENNNDDNSKKRKRA